MLGAVYHHLGDSWKWLAELLLRGETVLQQHFQGLQMVFLFYTLPLTSKLVHTSGCYAKYRSGSLDRGRLSGSTGNRIRTAVSVPPKLRPEKRECRRHEQCNPRRK